MQIIKKLVFEETHSLFTTPLFPSFAPKSTESICKNLPHAAMEVIFSHLFATVSNIITINVCNAFYQGGQPEQHTVSDWSCLGLLKLKPETDQRHEINTVEQLKSLFPSKCGAFEKNSLISKHHSYFRYRKLQVCYRNSFYQLLAEYISQNKMAEVCTSVLDSHYFVERPILTIAPVQFTHGTKRRQSVS